MRLINLFLTSFLVVFFVISLVYTQAFLPPKAKPADHNKKGHLAATSSEVPVNNNKKFN